MKMKINALIFSLLLVIPSVLVANVLAEARPYTDPVVLRLGNDATINHAAEQIRSFMPKAMEFSVESETQLRGILLKTLGSAIYVGHGQETGLMVGTSLVSWEDLGTIINSSPSSVHLLASCFSASVQVPDKFVYGFRDLVDVDEAAMWVTMLYYGLQQQINKIPTILKYFTNILIDKALHPERNVRAFLGYYYQSVRGIWHVKYNDQYGYYVKYTHPDTYSHYTWIGVQTGAGLSGNNLAVAHIPKSTVDTYSIGAVVTFGLGAIAAGAYLANLIGFIAGALIFLAGLIVAVFMETFVRDEMGAGWEWLQNWWSSWYGGGADLKLGSFMWIRFGTTFGFPFYYPLWYGGTALGIDGI